MTQTLLTTYQTYLHQSTPLHPDTLPWLATAIDAVNWEAPESAVELNHVAVMALVEAEQADPSLRAFNLEIAFEALETAHSQKSYLLATAHLALLNLMVGNYATATQLAYSTFLGSLQGQHQPTTMPMGLVYLPPDHRFGDSTDTTSEERGTHLQSILTAEDGNIQAIRLLAAVLVRSQPVFYNANGFRFLRLAQSVFPHSVPTQLKLGLASIMGQQWEGLWHLHAAQQANPTHAATLQALYLAYRDLNQAGICQTWRQVAQQAMVSAPSELSWKWSGLEGDRPFSYVPFDQTVLLAVEPSLRSIVTSVLLAEGDWFESEMEFWRTQITEGMTVIDVGANVGVYTFSAAKRVGATGQVFAVEPFSVCVQCLQETRRVNGFDWVTVCPGAASDRQGTARLSLHSANELNEIVTDDSPGTGSFESVECFTLDGLLDKYGVTQVDWLKIDAEGHEMQVLAGSDRLLTELVPNIIYENIAGASANNAPVAALLQSKGYQLFRYQPYAQELIPIGSEAELNGNLNVIAIHGSRLND
jgi:FkbM family methyltransferase